MIRGSSKERVFLMLKEKGEKISLLTSVLSQLALREPIFHHPEKFGKTKEALLEMTHEGFWEVGASGTVYTRAEGINTLVERYNDPTYQDLWEPKDFELVEIAPDNYLLTYILIQGKRITRRSTIWRKAHDTWKILYHQGTLVKGDVAIENM